MGHMTEIFNHPSVVESTSEQLTEEILRSRLWQQRVITWVIGGVGGAAFLIVLGIAIAVWRFALTF